MTLNCRLTFSRFLAAFMLLSSAAAAGPVIGQTDDFEDGTTQGWQVNLLGMGPAPPEALPTNIPTGGPGGQDDNFLQLTSLGVNGPGGRLVALNLDSRWTGDYLTSGVNALTVDVNNLGSTDLFLRLLFEHAAGGPPTDVAFSTNSVTVAAGSGWTPVTFLIRPGDLTAATGSVEAALSDTSVLRIFHSPSAQFPGPAVAAVLGVDNITAAAVPEPGSLVLLATGLSGMGLVVHKRRKADASPSTGRVGRK